MRTFYIYNLTLHNGLAEMWEAAFVGPAARLGVSDSISVRLVSYRAHIKDKIITHLLYIHFVASCATSEMRGAMLRSDSLENRCCRLNTPSIHELNNSN